MGHLPSAGGGPQTSKGWEESLHDRVGQAGQEGDGNWRWDGTGAPRGSRGRGSHTQKGPLTVRESMGTGRDLWGIEGSEGNMASISPTH